METTGDGHLGGFCVDPLVVPAPIFKVSAWKNAMGAMAKRRDKCHGSHGKKETMAKRRLGQMP